MIETILLMTSTSIRPDVLTACPVCVHVCVNRMTRSHGRRAPQANIRYFILPEHAVLQPRPLSLHPSSSEFGLLRALRRFLIFPSFTLVRVMRVWIAIFELPKY